MSSIRFTEESKALLTSLGYEGFSLLVQNSRVQLIGICGRPILNIPSIVLSNNKVNIGDIPILLDLAKLWLKAKSDKVSTLISLLKLSNGVFTSNTPVELGNNVRIHHYLANGTLCKVDIITLPYIIEVTLVGSDLKLIRIGLKSGNPEAMSVLDSIKCLELIEENASIIKEQINLNTLKQQAQKDAQVIIAELSVCN